MKEALPERIIQSEKDSDTAKAARRRIRKEDLIAELSKPELEGERELNLS